jgi:hypothetical protein
MRTLFTALLSISVVVGFQARALLQGPAKVSASLIAAAENGPVRVIVHLRVPMADVARGRDAMTAQRAAIAAAQDETLLALPGVAEVTARLSDFPLLGVVTDREGLQRLNELPTVVAVELDAPMQVAPVRSTKNELSFTTDLIQADVLWSQGTEGAGFSVALLGSGIERDHVFYGGRLAAEACFSTNAPALNISSLCPGGVSELIGPPAGINCGSGVQGCELGTPLAGIIMGRFQTLSGVARSASIIPIQVMSRNTTPGPSIAFFSDLIRGLNHVHSLATSGSLQVAAVQIAPQIGVDFIGPCDSINSGLVSAIAQLRAVGIPTIFASGDESLQGRVRFPACISNAVTVTSAVGNASGTFVSGFANRGPEVDLAAPGEGAPGAGVRSSALFQTFGSTIGTPQAAAHVAGAWALLKSRLPTASVDTILEALRRTGDPAIDPFTTAGTFPRIRLDRAAGSLGPAGSPTSVLVNINGSTVNVTWELPFDGSVPPGYQVEITSTITGQPAIINVGFARSLITTLPNGTYTLRVRSVSTGAASVDIPFVVGPATRADAPLPPVGLRAEVVDRRVTLSWNVDANSNFINTYFIEAGSSLGATNFGVFEIPNQGTTMFTVDNVQPGTYYVRMKARNQYGTSAASNEVVLTVTAVGCVVPLPPSPLNATVVGSLVTLNWSPPAVEGSVTGYIVEVGSAPGLSNIAQLQTGTATLLSATGPPGVYFVRVRAVSACGLTGPTNEVVVVIP